MGRKSYEGTGVLPGIEEDARTASAPRAPSKKVSSNSARTLRFSTPRLIATFVTAVVVLAAILYAFHRIEQFLIMDSRFALGGPGDDSSLQVTGAAHASRPAIEKIFANDEGGSVYLIPLSERRDALRNVPWIREASVARVWPNRVIVRVQERTPVAFVRLNVSRFGLIDGDGVVLPTATDRFKLPVLTGVRASDPVAKRHEGVQRMLRLTADLGDVTSNISDVDVSDGDNLKVSQPYDGRILTLLLGDRNFAARYGNFVKNYSQIQQRLPGAAVLDLRLEDRITVVE
ncbi:MAG: Polypeptide-transport-associated domain protein FtsQ-type [Bryobacterales bacterium]|nr:Polypeptide-transport-associated domain protein FtsQ-type [Bryobacterales bacterium]